MTASRAKLFAAAVWAELERRKSVMDLIEDLSAVTVTVKFEPGSGRVRGLTWQEERDTRTRQPSAIHVAARDVPARNIG